MNNIKTYCPFCNSEQNGVRVGQIWFSFFKCTKCRNLKLVKSAAGIDYPDEYYGQGDAKFLGFTGKLRRRWHRSRAARIASFWAKEGKKLYDIGCGDGVFLEETQMLGFDVHGSEPYQRARMQAQAKTGCPIDNESFTETPDDSIDIVTCWQVIEHIENPREFLDLVKKKLRPGGLFAVSTVNLSSFQAVFFGMNWLHLDPPRHLWVAHRSDVEKILLEHGFEIEKRVWNQMEFGPVGFVDSIYNVIDKKRDRILEGLKNGFHSFGDRIAWVFGAMTTPLAILLTILETMAGRSATYELYCRKR
jgi:SAM-dependent methyltransferase